MSFYPYLIYTINLQDNDYRGYKIEKVKKTTLGNIKNYIIQFWLLIKHIAKNKITKN